MNRIEDLTYEFALDILFNGIEIDMEWFKSLNVDPPPEWHVWERPMPSLKIDDVIEKLVNVKAKSNAAKLDRARLQKLEEPCPYYAVRCAIAYAVDAARMECAIDFSVAERVNDLDNLTMQAGKLARNIVSFINKYGGLSNKRLVILFSPLNFKKPIRSEIFAQSKIAEDASSTLVPVLKNFAALAEQERKSLVVPGWEGDVHRRAFARYMIQWWRERT